MHRTLNNSSRVRPLPRLQPGFSLVELMVSVTIGLVIIAALVALFLGTSRNNRQMATANSLIENGRFAIQLLESDLVHAGYWGTHVPDFDDPTFQDPPADVPASVPDPCLAYDPANWDTAYLNSLIGLPVQSYDAATVCGSVVTDVLANSDVLVVRHVEECAAGTADCAAATVGKLYLQASLCATETTPYVFGAQGTAAFTLTRRDCSELAEKRRFTSHIYYVRNYAVTAGDGIPTLVRSEFDLSGVALAHQAPVALIEGVDGLRVELGVDDVSVTGADVNFLAYSTATVWADPATKTKATNRGDGIPDGAFIRCTTAAPCTAEQLMNVTAARIYVLARSREPTPGYVDTKTYSLGTAGTVGPFNDGFKRHVYSATVPLPNIAGRRARP